MQQSAERCLVEADPLEQVPTWYKEEEGDKDDGFWQQECERTKDLTQVRAFGHLFRLGEEMGNVKKANGGKKFLIHFKDGRRYDSTNLISYGRIPESVKDKLKDNAEITELG